MRLGPVPAGVRPVSDRAREGLFSSLGPGACSRPRVLDLFAGTGAMGIEALSRGAAQRRRSSTGRRRRAARDPAATWTGPGWRGRATVQTQDVAGSCARARPPRAARSTSSSATPRTTLGAAELDEVLARARPRVARRRGVDGRRDAGDQEFHACHSATLGRREAAPLRRQPRVVIRPRCPEPAEACQTPPGGSWA